MVKVTKLPLIKETNIEKSGIPYLRTMEGELGAQLNINLEKTLEEIEKELIQALANLPSSSELRVYRGGNHVKVYSSSKEPHEDFNNQTLLLMIADTPIY